MLNWTEKDHQLQAEATFTDFAAAFAFMTEVAFAAEAVGHHPNWQNMYNKVHFRLSTHDAGGVVTEKDHALAARIDEIYRKHA